MSAKDADALMRPGPATPADAVMSSKRPPPRFSPQLIAARLTEEIDVEQTVAVDVRDGDAVSVVVVRRLVGAAGIVHDAVLERDAALLRRSVN